MDSGTVVTRECSKPMGEFTQSGRFKLPQSSTYTGEPYLHLLAARTSMVMSFNQTIVRPGAPRNRVMAPNITTRMRLSRAFKLGEKASLIPAEAFTSRNHTNYASVNNIVALSLPRVQSARHNAGTASAVRTVVSRYAARFHGCVPQAASPDAGRDLVLAYNYAVKRNAGPAQMWEEHQATFYVPVV